MAGKRVNSVPSSGLRAVASLTLCALASGCAGAPTFDVVGAFFPAWMLCALVGIIATAIARLVLVSTGRAESVPYALLVCSAIGTTVGVLLWLIVFGR